MKIYKNPDGSNFDVLYPTLFFGSFGFIIFFLFQTCITTDQFWGLALFSILSAYGIHFYLTKKKGNTFSFANLFLASTATPVIIALCLTFNYYVSFEMFHEKTALKGNVEIYNHNVYIRYISPPDVCTKLFKLQGVAAIAEFDSVESKINKGILGFPVIKYHKFSKAE